MQGYEGNTNRVCFPVHVDLPQSRDFLLVGVCFNQSIHGFTRTVNPVCDVFTCSESYVTRPLVGKKRMLTDMRDV